MAEKQIHISILSPKEKLFDGEVSHAVFPGAEAPFAVYPMHAPIISSLIAGAIRCVKPTGEEKVIDITGGFVEVKGDGITACVEQ